MKTRSKKDKNEYKKKLPINQRIVKKNLVYVIGLSKKLVEQKDLDGLMCFGQYGRVKKLVVNKNKPYQVSNTNE